jgi:hypothetical protein
VVRLAGDGDFEAVWNKSEHFRKLIFVIELADGFEEIHDDSSCRTRMTYMNVRLACKVNGKAKKEAAYK